VTYVTARCRENDGMSDEATRQPHYLCLALFTLGGAFVGPFFREPICPHGGIFIVEQLAPVVVGAIAGAIAEFILRSVRRD
jgi:hypothetical protein